MAYGYKAHYGYYIDPNGSAQGIVTNLDGKNISDCVITDQNSKFFIGETYRLVYPSSASQSSDRAAMRGRFHLSIPDWRYTTLFPGQTALSGVPDQDVYQYMYWGYDQITLVQNYDPFQIEKVKKKGNMFVWCPKLCKAIYPDLHGKKACTFVYLYNQHKLIDQNGSLYTVGSTGTITRILDGIQNKSGTHVHAGAYLNNVLQSSAFILHVWHETIGQTEYTRVGMGQLSLNSGAVYSWYVWLDADQVQTNVSTIIQFYGFDIGAYDYKSEIGKDPDPYSPDDKSDTGGGGGTGVIPAPQPTPLPGISDFPVCTAALNMYELTDAQMIALHDDLWNSNFFSSVKKLMYAPIENIVALLAVPFEPSSAGTSVAIKAGDYTFASANGFPISSQYKVVDCGSVNIPEIWGSYLDYHCRINLYLPFIGTIMLQPEDVINHDINVTYVLDALTGSCIAYVMTDGVLTGQYGGSCGYAIPMTGSNYNNLISNIISLTTAAAATIASAMTTGGITAPIAAADAATALNVATSKKDYQKTGGLGGSNAAMNCRIPYMTIYCPNLCAPDMQNRYTGYPSYITSKLSDQSGYTEVYKCHISAAGASDQELIEIEMLLKEGVVIA